MTQEDKQLLLKDLCARLPYQPICEFTDTEDDFCTATAALGYSLRDFVAGKVLIKPYLRPMSSMTKAERAQLEFAQDLDTRDAAEISISHVLDFFLEHHLDHHGLILMGLALEAPEGMYGKEEIE